MLGTRHTDASYEEELRRLGTHVARMTALSERMARDAVTALRTRDGALARAVVASDPELDRLEIECDAMALRTLARRAPFGEDLRLVMACVKVVTDLERMGDLACNLAQRALELMQDPVGLGPGPEVEQLADAALREVGDAFAAWQARDADAARAVVGADRTVDALNRTAFATLLQLAREQPGQFDRALALTSICRYLERIADHAVNVAEQTVFLVDALDVRHGLSGDEGR
ncbi:MAG: hypothetical protein RLZZ299_1991 [Pseudomonadota bacterium]|jgi:phosphate transport system protein